MGELCLDNVANVQSVCPKTFHSLSRNGMPIVAPCPALINSRMFDGEVSFCLDWHCSVQFSKNRQKTIKFHRNERLFVDITSMQTKISQKGKLPPTPASPEWSSHVVYQLKWKYDIHTLRRRDTRWAGLNKLMRYLHKISLFCARAARVKFDSKG